MPPEPLRARHREQLRHLPADLPDRPIKNPTAIIEQRTCASCDKQPAGDGGILCPTCLARVAGLEPARWVEGLGV
jgi:hypothetical protein